MRFFLLPFSFLYGLVISTRNYLFDKGVLKQSEFLLPVISVGNLTTGGTGKSPHVLMIASMLNEHFKIAVLSRGYGRKSKGFRIVKANDKSSDSGDEPLQYLHYLPNITVAVCERRTEGIVNLLGIHPVPEIILLDDAFQHRYVKPGLNILLTDYNHPFYDDYLLPSGNLRESRKGAMRADLIIVSKSPLQLSVDSRETIRKKIKKYSLAPVCFSVLRYRETVPLNSNLPPVTLAGKPALLLTGIANPSSLKKYLAAEGCVVEEMIFNDHHQFTTEDFALLQKKFDKFALRFPGALIITTRKDAARFSSVDLMPLVDKLPIYIQDIQAEVMEDDKNIFIKTLNHYAQSYKGIR